MPAQIELDNSYRHHPPLDDQVKRYDKIRKQAKKLAELIVAVCPESCERSLALTKVEEAAMWANKAIACNEGL